MRMNRTGVPRALRAYVSGSYPVGDAEALRRVRAPALILAHENDPIHDADVARRLAGLLPNATLRVWPEPLSMYDDVDAFATEIGDFLSGTTT
jgi:pimeloyl-ACP methyl ester carboxylesterase